MKSPAFLGRQVLLVILHRQPRALGLVIALLLADVAFAGAQISLPIAVPIATATPAPINTPAPTASPAPAATPGTTVIDGITDLGAYRQARQPTASVAITFPVKNILSLPTQSLATRTLPASPASQAAGVLSTLQPTALDGIFSEVNLGFLSGSNPPPPATVTLQFNPSRAGTAIWVQTLDGGSLQTQDAEGHAVNIQGGGWIELNAAGQISFTFQAPAFSARYQVLVRLDNVSSVLPFLVPDPTQG